MTGTYPAWSFELPFKSFITASQVTEYITELFSKAYFDQERTALVIFKYCQLKFDRAIRALFVANALGFYTGKRKDLLLKGTNQEERFIEGNSNITIIIFLFLQLKVW